MTCICLVGCQVHYLSCTKCIYICPMPSASSVVNQVHLSRTKCICTSCTKCIICSALSGQVTFNKASCTWYYSCPWFNGCLRRWWRWTFPFRWITTRWTTFALDQDEPRWTAFAVRPNRPILAAFCHFSLLVVTLRTRCWNNNKTTICTKQRQ
jgi:hypothetical protein